MLNDVKFYEILWHSLQTQHKFMGTIILQIWKTRGSKHHKKYQKPFADYYNKEKYSMWPPVWLAFVTPHAVYDSKSWIKLSAL